MIKGRTILLPLLDMKRNWHPSLGRRDALMSRYEQYVVVQLCTIVTDQMWIVNGSREFIFASIAVGLNEV